ncbi:phosphate signaling complex protein PhoU [Candidatus Methylospira mobilis]|nr:phosphate signaling complex protein PhoU [Candidatus Methylospira mobilis]WNV04932.1 phosphate signaling complex protein PhoU [Candidatus Methylospira mobilis]
MTNQDQSQAPVFSGKEVHFPADQKRRKEDDQSQSHTVVHFDQELFLLRNSVMAMGGRVLDQLLQALEALENHDTAQARVVLEKDLVIDKLEIDTNAYIFSLLARRAPVAKDLRVILASSKIINNLERIGDETLKLARFTLELAAVGHQDNTALEGVFLMGEMAIAMLRKALNVFDSQDRGLAIRVAEDDLELDSEFRKTLHSLIDSASRNPSGIGDTIGIALLIKALERIGDHAHNIAEYVVFQIEGGNIA